MRANLAQYSLAVQARFSPGQPMGVGMWVAAPAAKQLLEPTCLRELSAWLAEHELVPFTFNGFPYGDFHQRVVKHRVYQPTWFETPRVDYTLDLIDILHALLPDGLAGSISTLPIAWGTPQLTEQQWWAAAGQLGQVAERLARLEEDTGRRITLCLEPEPGCAVQRCEDVVAFFSGYLCPDRQSDWRKRYLGVCHDICHSAVMFEDQRDVLSRYAAAGIQVAKVQVSSAVEVDLRGLDEEQIRQRLGVLAAFAEDRYLHQTSIRTVPDGPVRFYEDLAPAFAAADQDPRLRQGQWRVHFHVPIYLESFHSIGTTRPDILRCLEAFGSGTEWPHFEVETYAWGVLPESLRREQLADGIADEMRWLVQAMP